MTNVDSILGTYQPGEFIFQCHIFSPFHTVLEVLKAIIVKWFAVPFPDSKYCILTHIYGIWKNGSEELFAEQQWRSRHRE